MSHTCAAHDPSCPLCAATARDAGLVRTIMTAGDRLDDITRARMWSRIEDRLDVPAPARRSAAWRRVGGIALVAVAAAATAVLALRAVRGHDSVAVDHDHELTVAAEATLMSRLGPHARAALVGPARLELLGTPGDRTAVRLHAGTLLAEFEGGAGRSLRIEARDLVAEVVGTLFAVEVRDTSACVAVAHGTVRVTIRDTVQLVTDHQQLCSNDAAPRPIPRTVLDQLDHHGAIIAAIARPEPASPVEAPPTIAAAPPRDEPIQPAIMAPRRDAPRTPAAEPARSATPLAPRASPATPARPTVAANEATAAPAARVPASETTVAPRPPVTAVPASETTATPRPPVTAVAASETKVTPRPPVTAVAASETTSDPRPPAASVATAVVPAPAVAPPPAPSAEALYRAAETALAAGDHAAADRALARLLELPGTTLADQALYERARIAYLDRSWATARRHLARLAAIENSPLAEPGHYLDCRIAMQAGDRDAERCLAGYRTAYPRSPHDLDVLALLVQLAHARAGCAGARTVKDELVGTYPRSDHAAAWRARCPEAP